MSVLDELVATARTRALPEGEVPLRGPSRFADALLRLPGGRIRVIAEVKRGSPSQGSIRLDADAVQVACAYVRQGAAAISVLTEPTRFGGSFEDLRAVAAAVSVPVLCKDFIDRPEHLRAAAVCGASAALLMVRVVGARLQALIDVARGYGMEPLVEVHSADELRIALASTARVIGVNNRDLSTLRIDRRAGESVLAAVPNDRIRVAESGYAGVEDIIGLDADAVLIGTALMRDSTLLGRMA